MRHNKHSRDAYDKRRRIIFAVINGTIALILIAIFIGIARPGEEAENESENQAVSSTEIEEQTAEAVYEHVNNFKDASSGEVVLGFDSLSLDSIDATKSLKTFSLSAQSSSGEAQSQTPTLSAEQETSINIALETLEERGIEAGFVFVDLSTSKGISYNAGQTFYGASSFKGPYCGYIGSQMVENNIADENTQITGTILVDGDSGYYPGGVYPLIQLIEDTIVISCNDSYQFLRDAFDSKGFSDYLTSLNIDTSLITDGSYGGVFPHYTPRDSAKLWCQTYLYLATKTDFSQKLANYFSTTEVSFIREGLKEQNAIVYDKAGWCAADLYYGDGVFNGICDAGIVNVDGRDYLLTIMTNAADNAEDEAKVSELAKSIVGARSCLL